MEFLWHISSESGPSSNTQHYWCKALLWRSIKMYLTSNATLLWTVLASLMWVSECCKSFTWGASHLGVALWAKMDLGPWRATAQHKLYIATNGLQQGGGFPNIHDFWLRQSGWDMLIIKTWFTTWLSFSWDHSVPRTKEVQSFQSDAQCSPVLPISLPNKKGRNKACLRINMSPTEPQL